MKIVIIGGGWAGCAAASVAVKTGAQVVLLERTDMLLGTGLVGGIMRNNGRFTAAEECIAMGGGLFQLVDDCLRHHNICFPGHAHADLYDIARLPGAVQRYLQSAGVQLHYQARVTKTQLIGTRMVSVLTEDGQVFDGDAFIDATGSFGPMNNCTKHGNGCVMCIMRCPSFGGRVSLCSLAGVKGRSAKRKDGSMGSMSGACKLMKDSLSADIAASLEKDGVVVLPVPPELQENHLSQKACQQYALKEYKDHLIVLDTGHAKLMVSYFELEKLHQIPGFENARYEDPYAGGIGNSMRFFDMAPRDDTMKVQGLENVLCAGEKAGPLVGHTEAMATGMLAGYNAARYAMKRPLMTLPRTLAVGEAIAWVREMTQTEDGLSLRYTFSGSVLFKRLRDLGLYSTDRQAIAERVDAAGLTLAFSSNK